MGAQVRVAGGESWGQTDKDEEGDKNRGRIMHGRGSLSYLPSDCVEFLPAHALPVLKVRAGAPAVDG